MHATVRTLVVALGAVSFVHCKGKAPAEVPIDADQETSAADTAADVATDVSVAPDAGDGSIATLTWSAVPNGERCGLEVATNAAALPARTWTSCGVGCLVGSASDPFSLATDRGLTARYADGDVTIRANVGGDGLSIHQLLRVSDGKTLGAVRIKGGTDCAIFGWDDGVPTRVGVVAGAEFIVGRWDASTRNWSWGPGWIKTLGVPLSMFGWRDAIGFTIEGSGLALVDTMAKAEARRIKADAAGQFAASLDDLVVWSVPSGGKDVILGFREPSAPSPQVFVAHDADAHVMTLTNERLVWIGTHGPLVSEGTYDSAELYWSGRPAVPSDVTIVKGPSLPATRGLLQLRAGPTHAATLGSMGTAPPSLIVVDFATKKVTAIRSRTGASFRRLMALSSTELIVAESDTAAPGSVVQRLLRLELSKLDAITASPW